MSDVDAIIERLEATVVRADTVTGEKWSGDMVRWSDAEAAVRAAADTRTREIIDWLWTDAPLKEAYAREMLADEVARRFPNGGTNDG